MYPYFILYVSADDMNSNENMVHTMQGGLGMGERDYYLEDDADQWNSHKQQHV